MTLLNDGKNLFIRKGDTGNIIYKNLPTDKNYSVYHSIYDPDTYKILGEIQGTFTQASGTVVFTFGTDYTDNLPVGEWEYGLKICAGGSEDTILPRAYTNDEGELVQEPAPTFTVWDKVVEGTE